MFGVTFFAVVALFTDLSIGRTLLARGSTPVIDVGYAKFQGNTATNGVYQWLGVRYAQPPIGKLRFQAPQNVTGDGSLVMKTVTGPQCLGTRLSSNDAVVAGSNEDCLYLNIFTPSNMAPNARLPVFFFLPGGGFNAGSPLPDGSTLIEASNNSIIVVTANYRVSAYGFLASSEIQAGASLNNGLKDQRMALQWIHDHISSFGGNPGRVVMGGASAGATSAAFQLAAYGGRDDGIFHGVISNSQDISPTRDVAESQFQYDALVNRTQCHPSMSGNADTLACLRALNSSFLQTQNLRTSYPDNDTVPFLYYNPVTDGDFLPDHPLALFSSGRFVQVPSIYGDVSDEGTIFAPKSLDNVDDANTWLQAQFTSITTDQLDTVQSLYPPQVQDWPNSSTFGKYYRSTATAFAYLRFICPGFHFNNATSQSPKSSAKSWNYHYNVTDPAQINAGLGVPHIAEQTPLWAASSLSTGSYGGANKPINALIQQYWISFVKNLDPNTQRVKGSAQWADWSTGQRLLVQNPSANGSIATTIMETVDPVRNSNCVRFLSWGSGLKM